MAKAMNKPLFTPGSASHFHEMVDARNADVAQALSAAAGSHSRGVRECIDRTADEVRQVVGDVSTSASGITRTLITSKYLPDGLRELAFGHGEDKDAVSKLKTGVLGELNKPN